MDADGREAVPSQDHPARTAFNQPWVRHWPEPEAERYRSWVARRRSFALSGYSSFTEVGLEGEWTTPYHLASCSLTGPVLLTYNYLDAPSAEAHRDELSHHGFLASMPFNRVLDLALAKSGLARSDLYVTHAFHLLPRTRSAAIPERHLDLSFDAIARHELEGRRIIALGEAAARLCRRHGLSHIATPHPSARGLSFSARAATLAEAIG